MAVIFAISGLGFAGANLLLARSLTVIDYALFALVMALLNVSIYIAPAGADGLVNRRRLEPSPGMLRRVLFTSAVVGTVTVVVGALLYPLDTLLLLFILTGVIAGGATTLAAAYFQSRLRFEVSIAVSQSANLILLLAAAGTLVLAVTSVWPPIATLVIGYLAVAGLSWGKLLRKHAARAREEEWYGWAEPLSYAGVRGVGIVLGQAERLIIPWFLSLEALATYGVLAAIALSPFRMLQVGVGYTLLPRLREAGSIRARQRLLVGEAVAVGAAAIAAALFVWFAGPLIVEWLLAGKYYLPSALILAALAAGLAKILTSFLNTIIEGLGSTRELFLMNLIGWGSVGLTIACAALGATWGLVGLVYGVAVGWMGRAVATGFLVIRHVR